MASLQDLQTLVQQMIGQGIQPEATTHGNRSPGAYLTLLQQQIRGNPSQVQIDAILNAAPGYGNQAAQMAKNVQSQSAPPPAGPPPTGDGNQPSVPTTPLPTTPTVPTQGTIQPGGGSGLPPFIPAPNQPGLPTIPGMPGGSGGPGAYSNPIPQQGQPGQQPGLPPSLLGLPPPPMVTTPQLPTILGLTTPSTPVNQPTVPGQDISPYIPTTSQQQQDIVGQAIQQSQGVAGQNLQQLRGIIDPYIQQQFKSFTDPQGSQYQSTIGQLNNIGMADSGAFPQALADKLAPLLSQGALQLGQETLIPSFANQQNLVSQGADVQSNLGLDSLQRFIEQQNFSQQSDLAKQLAAQGASSSFGSGIGGLLGGGLGAGAGALFGGLPGAGIGAMIGSKGGSGVGGGTWICTHLKNLGLATPEEVEKVHKRLIVTLTTHALDWIQYVIQAPVIILLLDQIDFDWSTVKRLFIDDIIQEQDADTAFHKYQDACWSLYRVCGGEAWS